LLPNGAEAAPMLPVRWLVMNAPAGARAAGREDWYIELDR
jgi:hypothetical protein